MQQINNGFCSCYYLTEEGKLYDAAAGRYKKPTKDDRFILKTEDNKTKKIALRSLYKLVFNKPYCKDNIKDLDNEIWQEIENTNGVYYVSNLGRVKSYAAKEAKILRATISEKGYYRLDIIQEGQRATKFVHRLVAAAFLLPPKSIDMQLHHKDFNKDNNAAANLEWLTVQQHTKKHIEQREKIKNATEQDTNCAETTSNNSK